VYNSWLLLMSGAPLALVMNKLYTNS
jgi:hypothetical protein